MKDLTVSLLLDFYGNLLPPKQLDMMEQYYADDLSLSEIAENAGITRQGVHDNIRRAANELKQYEEKLGLLKRFSDISDAANKIKEILSMELTDNNKNKIFSLLDVIEKEA